jgi:hypothetical protein
MCHHTATMQPLGTHLGHLHAGQPGVDLHRLLVQYDSPSLHGVAGGEGRGEPHILPLACAPCVCPSRVCVCSSRVPLACAPRACAPRACATYAPPLCVCPSYQEQSLDMLMWVVFVAFVAGNCSYLPLDLWFNVFGTYYAYVGLHGQKWKRDHVASKLKVAHNRVM